MPTSSSAAAAGKISWPPGNCAGSNIPPRAWRESFTRNFVESPVVLTNMQRMYSPTISESVIGLLITLTRRLNDYTLQTRERRWNDLDGLTGNQRTHHGHRGHGRHRH